MSIFAPLACASASDFTVPGTFSMSPKVAMRTPCSRQHDSFVDFGDVGHADRASRSMITSSDFGKSERKPNRAMACW